MICDIIETCVEINNSFNINIIPYSYLTRVEKEPLMALNKLNMIRLEISSNYVKYYKPPISIENSMILKYQTLCDTHLQKLLEHEKIGNYIYICMDHISDSFKTKYKDFYLSELYNHLFIVLELYHYDDLGIYVKSVNLNRLEFMKHQELARAKSNLYNLKYNLKEYITCPCCVSTLCGISLYYKDNMGGLPKNISQIPNDFNNALVLFKNDRMTTENIFNVAQKKWKSNTFEQYFIKLKNVCESRQWEYEKIISYIHKSHFDIYKVCERLRDKNSNDLWHNRSGRNLNSPTWRSNITVS